jgi:hypothetical protein
VTYSSDGDSALDCNAWYTYEDITQETAILEMNGAQNWTPGHMIARLYADTPDDPSVISHVVVDNLTAGAWYGYKVDYSFSGIPDPTSLVLASAAAITANWSVATTGPSWNGSAYVGQLLFTADAPAFYIANDGSEFEFSYKLTFAGSTTYTFLQELTPLIVPEPTALSLLGLGFVGLLLRRRAA